VISCPSTWWCSSCSRKRRPWCCSSTCCRTAKCCAEHATLLSTGAWQSLDTVHCQQLVDVALPASCRPLVAALLVLVNKVIWQLFDVWVDIVLSHIKAAESAMWFAIMRSNCEPDRHHNGLHTASFAFTGTDAKTCKFPTFVFTQLQTLHRTSIKLENTVI